MGIGDFESDGPTLAFIAGKVADWNPHKDVPHSGNRAKCDICEKLVRYDGDSRSFVVDDHLPDCFWRVAKRHFASIRSSQNLPTIESLRAK